jgi:hypothetical protein
VPSLPRISVVVPSLDQGRFLRQALSSLFHQRYPELEVVVMDGGSKDESLAIIREHAHALAYWQSRPDGGQAAAINEGVRHCSGDLVTWLNADDFHWQDALWVVARAYVRHPDHGLYVGNGFRHVEATGRRRRFCPGHVAFSRQALGEGLDYVLQPATFVLRRAWEAVGGLDPSLRYGLDWDLFLRIADGHPVVTINELLAASREHGETKTALGGLRRAAELIDVVHRKSDRRLTPGTAYYVLHALRAAAAGELPSAVTSDLDALMESLQRSMQDRWGGDGVFPEASDRQDVADVPLGTPPELAGPSTPGATPPRVSVIVLGHGHTPRAAVAAVLAQGLADLEVLLVHPAAERPAGALPDGDSRCRAIAVAGEWTVPRALEAGIEAATGEIVTWLDAGDRLADGALGRALAAVADDPETDAVAGHAMYVDRHDRGAHVRSGGRKVGIRLGGERARGPWPSRRARLFVRRRAIAQARAAAAGPGFWPALASVLDRGRTVVAERTLWLYPVGSRAEEDERPPDAVDARDPEGRPTILQRWVAALPRHGNVRRLGRSVVGRVRKRPR